MGSHSIVVDGRVPGESVSREESNDVAGSVFRLPGQARCLPYVLRGVMAP